MCEVAGDTVPSQENETDWPNCQVHVCSMQEIAIFGGVIQSWVLPDHSATLLGDYPPKHNQFVMQ